MPAMKELSSHTPSYWVTASTLGCEHRYGLSKTTIVSPSLELSG